PLPANLEYAKSVVSLALPYLESLTAVDDSAHSVLSQKLQWLLVFFNGDWRSDTITHHCSVRCPCGSRSAQEAKQKAATVYVCIVLGSRPPVPALAKWLKCGQTARWFFLASAVHNLLQKSYASLYGVGTHAPGLRDAIADLDSELTQLVRAGDAGAGAQAFMLPDLPVPKIARVRAMKSVSWVLSPDMLADVCVSIYSTRAAEHFAEWLMLQQR
ncbi:unnamed protein product, partial [Effrenium voratum]